MLDVINTIQSILNAIIPVLVALGVVYFVWGVVAYVIGDAEEAKKKGKDRIIYGIIGLAIIVSLWGIVNLLVKTFGLDGDSAPAVNNLVTSCAASGGIAGLLCQITAFIGNSIIPLIFLLGVVLFVWGVIKFFLINADEEAKRSQGKQFILWGIIVMVVITSIWGIVRILGGSFANTSVLPGINPNSNSVPPVYTPPLGGGGVGGSGGGGTGGGPGGGGGGGGSGDCDFFCLPPIDPPL